MQQPWQGTCRPCRCVVTAAGRRPCAAPGPCCCMQALRQLGCSLTVPTDSGQSIMLLAKADSAQFGSPLPISILKPSQGQGTSMRSSGLYPYHRPFRAHGVLTLAEAAGPGSSLLMRVSGPACRNFIRKAIKAGAGASVGAPRQASAAPAGRLPGPTPPASAKAVASDGKAAPDSAAPGSAAGSTAAGSEAPTAQGGAAGRTGQQAAPRQRTQACPPDASTHALAVQRAQEPVVYVPLVLLPPSRPEEAAGQPPQQGVPAGQQQPEGSCVQQCTRMPRCHAADVGFTPAGERGQKPRGFAPGAHLCGGRF